jgi:hypothetical protein
LFKGGADPRVRHPEKEIEMLKRHVGLLLTIGLVLAGGAVAVAQSDPQRPALESEKRGPRGPKHHRLGEGVLGRAVHGDVVVRTGEDSFDTVTFDKGEVDEATTAEQLVLNRPDGATVRVALTDDTKYKGVEGAEGIREGAPAFVVHKDGKARTVAQRPERPRGNKAAPANVQES